MSDFTDEEREQIRKLLKNEEAINEWIELQGAKKLVFHTYRQALLGIAGLIGASILLWDSIKAFIRGMLE